MIEITIPKNKEDLKEWAKEGKAIEGEFKLFCKHKNGYQMPIYPFEWRCLECGQITSNEFILKQMKGGLS